MAEEANKVLTEQSRDPEFSSTIAQTLKNLSENTEKMQVIIIYSFFIKVEGCEVILLLPWINYVL